MGWEDRDGRRYYYRKERDGASVRSVYVGSGQTAVLFSCLDGIERQKREGARARRRAERDDGERLDAALDELREACDLLTAGTLLAAGFHTHKRQWRRRRDVREVDDYRKG